MHASHAQGDLVAPRCGTSGAAADGIPARKRGERLRGANLHTAEIPDRVPRKGANYNELIKIILILRKNEANGRAKR